MFYQPMTKFGRILFRLLTLYPILSHPKQYAEQIRIMNMTLGLRSNCSQAWSVEIRKRWPVAEICGIGDSATNTDPVRMAGSRTVEYENLVPSRRSDVSRRWGGDLASGCICSSYTSDAQEEGSLTHGVTVCR
jgi:hypothetical protein